MSEVVYDVVVIGAGPAGIQAAMHAVRKKATVLLLGRIENSALYRTHVENYAFVAGISHGAELLALGLQQATNFGAEVLAEDVLKISKAASNFSLVLESGRVVTTKTVIFCIGVSKKKLGVPGETEFLGRGVSYCVDCDANFYRHATVVVTGGQSAAVDGALTLLEYASKVYLVADDLSVSEELRSRLHASSVEILTSSVQEIFGERVVTAVRLSDGTRLETDGVFIELGAKSALELATQIGVAFDTDFFKYLLVNRKQATNVAGVYAAGDLTGPPFQMAKAVGEGCVAGLEAATYARKKQ